MKGKAKNGLLGLLKGKVKGGGGPLGLYIFFFIPNPNRFGSGWPVQAHQNRKPNRTGHFPKYFNRFNQFFLSVRFFRLIFFRFFRLNRFSGFFAHP